MIEELDNNHARKPRHHRRLPLIITVPMVIAVGVAIWILLQGNNKYDAVRQFDTSFTIYYPDRLPEGYQVDERSLSYDQSILFYNIIGKTGTLAVSQQALPSKKLSTELPKTKELQIDAGKAIVSRFSTGQTVVTIANEESFITLNSAAKINDKELTILLEALQPID